MKKTVLIVDDAKFMRKLLSRILEEGGFEVAGEATGGKEALELFHSLKPDLVTMDLVIPDMSGVDAIREIRKEDPSAVIVVISAMGQQALVAEALQAGAKDFIVKPFHPSIVLEIAERALKG